MMYMLSGKHAFEAESSEEQLKLIDSLLGKTAPQIDRRANIQHFLECSIVLADLLAKMLCPDPKDRFSITECL